MTAVAHASTSPASLQAAPTIVRVWQEHDLAQRLSSLNSYVATAGNGMISQSPSWMTVLAEGLGQKMYCLEASQNGATCGILPLAYMKSVMFGRFLVSLPYLNYAGVIANDPPTERALLNRALDLADELHVRFLQLRHDHTVNHPALVDSPDAKVNVRLPLPDDIDQLWAQLPPKVRNQVRKARKCGLIVEWGGAELLDDFYSIFSRNMRDLGTPVYGSGLFRVILRTFQDRAELCIVRAGAQPVSAALLLHGREVTELPSASSLRSHNHTCANVLMYWHLLQRAIARGQTLFDFGRSSPNSGSLRFKQQWGATAAPAPWQYYLRQGDVSDLTRANPRYRHLIRIWKHVPAPISRVLGPWCVRRIP